MSSETSIHSRSALKELFSLKDFFLGKLNASNQKLILLTEELHELKSNLMPVIIKGNGLNKCIQQLVKKLNASDNLFISLHTTYLNNSLKPNVEYSIYAIIEEALLNTTKHAHAKSAHIKIEQSTSKIFVQISDSGKGFDVMQVLKSGTAKGLLELDRRCKEIGSSVSILSEPGNTCISFEIPLEYV
jgi:signal transduction histidine kinase